VNKGDGMFLLPSGKEVTIKSIQVMDVNVSSAPAGSHVGLALNNVNERDMEDNYAVASIKEVAKDYRIDLERSELFKGDLSASKSMIAPVFGRNFQVTVSSDLKAISFAKPIVKLSRKIILFDSSLPVGKNRVAGRFSLL
jgi:selenocysteine-specific translation elongation factor